MAKSTSESDYHKNFILFFYQEFDIYYRRECQVIVPKMIWPNR